MTPITLFPMGKKDQSVSLFNLEGRFLGFLREDGYKLKYLQLATADGEQCIKLSKEARASVGQVLRPGDWIQVWGEKTVKHEHEIKLKAYRIRVAAPGHCALAPATPPPATATSTQPKATILICQKADCMKRGGKAVCQALEAALRDRGLTDQVTIRGTGCMKQCKAAPNLVVMPGKTRYSKVTPGEVKTLLDHHFATGQPVVAIAHAAQVVQSTPAL